MDIVKLDSYEYQIKDFYDKQKKYLRTLVYLSFDDVTDPSIYDIVHELSVYKTVHLNGRYYGLQELVIEENVLNRSAKLILHLIETTDFREGVNS